MLEAIFGFRKVATAKAAATDVMLLNFIGALDVRIKGAATAIKYSMSDNIVDTGTKRRSEMLALVQQEFIAVLKKCTDPTTAAVSDDHWNSIYNIERLMVFVEPPETLWYEVKRRLGEAAEENILALPRLTAAADALSTIVFDSNSPEKLKPEFEDRVRALLLDILEETHWDIQRKFSSRPIRKSATRRIVSCGMCAFALLILPYVWMYVESANSRLKPIEKWSWLPLYSALTAGLFGALFSRLLYLQQKWDSLTIGGLRDAREFTSILLRGCVGMTGAVVVSFFLMSEVIDGALFPNFSEIGLDITNYAVKVPPQAATEFAAFHLIFPSKHLSLLIVWSFLAGFSERLIPTILQDTEKTINQKAK